MSLFFIKHYLKVGSTKNNMQTVAHMSFWFVFVAVSHFLTGFVASLSATVRIRYGPMMCTVSFGGFSS